MSTTQNPRKRLNDGNWARLLTEINKENVILVLGTELIFVKQDNGEHLLLKDYLQQEMSKDLHISCDENLDFAQLSYEYNQRAWNQIDSEPYYWTCAKLKELYNANRIFSPAIEKLLSIDKFKLVLTTSFDNSGLEIMKRACNISKVQHLSYEKRSNKQDIPDGILMPTFYHMFGKASAEPHGFVLTDDDLLEFMHYWMDENYRPKKLSNILREKYILVVGCNYPNWLFRFFFHSMKFSSQQYAIGKTGILADSILDKELMDFLARMNIGVHDDAMEFVDELTTRWREYNKAQTAKEIFISYASEDYDRVRPLVEKLEHLGIGVWFDKKALEPGDEYAREIKEHIQQCKAFVPILSRSTAVPGRRFFKMEWSWGFEEKEMRFTDKFIYPVLIDSIDIESISEKFAKLHIIDTTSNIIDIDTEFKKIIRDIRLTNI